MDPQLRKAIQDVKEKRNHSDSTIDSVELEKCLREFKTELYIKRRHNSVYHDEILKRDGYLRSFMQKVNEMYTRLQAEHAEAIDLSKKTQIAAEALEKLRIYVRENEKLKKEKEKFEEMYIKVNAKYEKLEQLLGTNSSVNNPNLLTKIVFNQWKLNTAHCEAQTQQRNEILNKVTEHFTAEKTTNVKLIQENEHIKEIKKQLEEDNLKLKERCQENLAIIASLKTKIKMLEDARSQNPTRPEGGIKDEPIEIGD
ncbi:hypothetical protein NQ315_003380 [Exocentrus adspersus]|uniref:Uncharacterized protein n=1 Tax=Exocentrus adspersus TaxID=1586481 RepID=A0AAV8VND2_9CUCU|nr:hypothetical protein NQ315_003380 [Exocentrus adspersus]